MHFEKCLIKFPDSKCHELSERCPFVRWSGDLLTNRAYRDTNSIYRIMIGMQSLQIIKSYRGAAR